MSKEFNRSDRVGAQLQRELADLVRSLDNSKLGMLTIQAVQVARDFSHAKVYYTFLGGSLSEQETTAYLKKAAPHLRHELALRVRMRVIPELHFLFDESIERGNRLSALIEEAVKSENAKDNEPD